MARGTELSGSTVLVTGGGSGLGRRMALLAAERGARVLIWDLSADGGTKVRDEIRAARFPRLLPVLKEEEVAVKILDGVEAGREKLVLPPLVNLVPAARILPVAAFDRLMDVPGINRTMDDLPGGHY